VREQPGRGSDRRPPGAIVARVLLFAGLILMLVVLVIVSRALG
jgi:hypothetical protein